MIVRNQLCCIEITVLFARVSCCSSLCVLLSLPCDACHHSLSWERLVLDDSVATNMLISSNILVLSASIIKCFGLVLMIWQSAYTGDTFVFFSIELIVLNFAIGIGDWHQNFGSWGRKLVWFHLNLRVLNRFNRKVSIISTVHLAMFTSNYFYIQC